MLTFVALKKNRQHITRLLSALMLMVFSMASTPWNLLHHHADAPHIVAEKHCTHSFHIKAQKEECLICTVHFEKNFLPASVSFQTFFSSKQIIKNDFKITFGYVALISTSLRGPPAIS